LTVKLYGSHDTTSVSPSFVAWVVQNTASNAERSQKGRMAKEGLHTRMEPAIDCELPIH
jgi:hypothetical protein